MRKTLYLPAVLAFALAACDKTFEETNQNPNQNEYGDILASSMLADLVYYTADGEIYRTYQINGELMQYTTQMYTENIHRYLIRDSYVSGAWNYLARWAADADHMVRLAREQDDPDMEAVGLTMRALNMANLTDIWGSVPLFDAFRGSGYGTEQDVTPAFDTQEEVYRQLLDDLARANRLYSSSATTDSFVAGVDLLYGGDWSRWRKFTNSLRLRLLMRLSNRDDVMHVSDSIAMIVNNPGEHPVFSSNDDGAVLRYTGIEPNVNRFGSTTLANFTSNARRMGSYFIALMDAVDDPRLGIYAVQQNNQWKGLVSGYPSDETNATNCAYLNKAVLGDYTSPYAFMKYDEVLFILSEAACRGWIGGSAEDYYRQAVLASIEWWDGVNPSTVYHVSEAQKTQYLLKVPYNGSLQRIIEQKYIALFWVGYQSWCDYRRTGYPRLPIGPGTSNDHELPTRLVYPITLISTNNDNYKAAVARQGADDMHTVLWWSLKAVTE